MNRGPQDLFVPELCDGQVNQERQGPQQAALTVQSMGTTATTAGVIPNTAFMPAPLDSAHPSAPCFCQNQNSVSV